MYLAGTTKSQMLTDWAAYWSTSSPGNAGQWAGGTLTRDIDGGATYRSIDGVNGKYQFTESTPLDEIASMNPGIARMWYHVYGYTRPDDSYFFGGGVVRGTAAMLAWRVPPGSPGTGFSGRDGNGDLVVDKHLFDLYCADTGQSYPPNALVGTSPGGNLIVTFTSPGAPIINPYIAPPRPTVEIVSGLFPSTEARNAAIVPRGIMTRLLTVTPDYSGAASTVHRELPAQAQTFSGISQAASGISGGKIVLGLAALFALKGFFK